MPRQRCCIPRQSPPITNWSHLDPLAAQHPLEIPPGAPLRHHNSGRAADVPQVCLLRQIQRAGHDDAPGGEAVIPGIVAGVRGAKAFGAALGFLIGGSGNGETGSWQNEHGRPQETVTRALEYSMVKTVRCF